MVSYFSREFRNIDEHHERDLQTLEAEGCVYSYLFQDELHDFASVRIRLRPAEIIRYVDGVYGLEQWLRGINRGLGPEDALRSVQPQSVRHEAEEYNTWCAANGHDEQQFCPAAFLGGHLEELVCTNVPGRHEVLGMSYTADRRFLLSEIISSFPTVATFLEERDGGRPGFAVETEQDLRDLLFALLKPVFSDAILEDPAPKLGGGSKRIDLVIRTIETVVELKFVRDLGHARRIADELRVDIESYHSHPACKRLVCVVWDPGRSIRDRESLIADLSGARQKDRKTFVVEVRVLP